mmetsp:Transcript_4293/g.10335  ORF Transcript_4293/g.10335 Transcript_4293/m.10335 type:complete len:305 (+) Transcript_4293:66-980(+)
MDSAGFSAQSFHSESLWCSGDPYADVMDVTRSIAYAPPMGCMSGPFDEPIKAIPGPLLPPKPVSLYYQLRPTTIHVSERGFDRVSAATVEGVLDFLAQGRWGGGNTQLINESSAASYTGTLESQDGATAQVDIHVWEDTDGTAAIECCRMSGDRELFACWFQEFTIFARDHGDVAVDAPAAVAAPAAPPREGVVAAEDVCSGDKDCAEAGVKALVALVQEGPEAAQLVLDTLTADQIHLLLHSDASVALRGCCLLGALSVYSHAVGVLAQWVPVMLQAAATSPVSESPMASAQLGRAIAVGQGE